MTKFKVNFEIYGKHMTATVEANYPHQAIEIVQKRLVICSVDEIKPDKTVRNLMDIFGMK